MKASVFATTAAGTTRRLGLSDGRTGRQVSAWEDSRVPWTFVSVAFFAASDYLFALIPPIPFLLLARLVGSAPSLSSLCARRRCKGVAVWI